MALVPSVLCVELTATAALFAQLSYAHRCDPPVREPCARIAACLLIAGGGFLVLHRAATTARPQINEAARTKRAALVFSHAPYSLAAPARDRLHRSVDLLARDDR